MKPFIRARFLISILKINWAGKQSSSPIPLWLWTINSYFNWPFNWKSTCAYPILRFLLFEHIKKFSFACVDPEDSGSEDSHKNSTDTYRFVNGWLVIFLRKICQCNLLKSIYFSKILTWVCLIGLSKTVQHKCEEFGELNKRTSVSY